MLCRNRIKPKLLRDVKTEALLVFIRTTLENSFKQAETEKNQFQLSSKEDNDYVYGVLKELLTNLQDTVINSLYLRSLISKAEKNASLKIIAKKEEPLMVYYDCLVKCISNNLTNGINWIPELVVISLLCEWIIEEEKSTYHYPFLNGIDYLSLIEKYDNSRLNVDKEKKDIIMNMYKISSMLIQTLKNSTYKINTKRIKKNRKK